MTVARLSRRQRAAVELVVAGRVQWGHGLPEMSRRAHANGRPHTIVGFGWLIDGIPADGHQGRSFRSLEERGLILVRHDLVPTHMVPEIAKERVSIAGTRSTVTIPAHEEPDDPGWVAPVELTAHIN